MTVGNIFSSPSKPDQAGISRFICSEVTALTCIMRTEKETGRRALARFRLHTLSMTPNAQKNVRKIVGKQNF